MSCSVASGSSPDTHSDTVTVKLKHCAGCREHQRGTTKNRSGHDADTEGGPNSNNNEHVLSREASLSSLNQRIPYLPKLNYLH